MAFKQFRSGPDPKLLTPGTISSGLVPNIPSSTLCTTNKYFTNTSRTPSPVISLGVEEVDHDIKVAHMDNNPFVEFPIPEPSFVKNPLLGLLFQIISVSTRNQLQDEAIFCYFDAFLSSVEPKSYKEALTESYWIEAMQEELNEFERLEV
ncbi:hypothetical protein Tco_0107318 [Tanacetum coccineum]